MERQHLRIADPGIWWVVTFFEGNEDFENNGVAGHYGRFIFCLRERGQ